jgi:hypothetical protein
VAHLCEPLRVASARELTPRELMRELPAEWLNAARLPLLRTEKDLPTELPRNEPIDPPRKLPPPP